MAGTYSQLLYHLVFSTKHREPLIQPRLKSRLYKYLGGIIRGEKAILEEIGGMPDHVHLLVSLRTEPSVAEFLKIIKSKSSKFVNENKLMQGRFSWQIGYGAFTVCYSQKERVREYIQNQEEHHRVHSFQDELRTLLKKHGIPFDEEHLWD